MGIAFGKIFVDDPARIYDVNEESKYYNIVKPIEEQTGWDRVQTLFAVDLYGDMSPELAICSSAVSTAVIIGFFTGGLLNMSKTRADFMKQNLHEKFESKMAAQRSLYERAILGFGGGGIKLAWRLGAFVGIYMVSQSAIALYRNKVGIIDQVGGGSSAGFLYKFMQGPRAAFSGAVIGGGLGAIYGTFISVVTWMFGMTPQDLSEFRFRTAAQQIVAQNNKKKLANFRNDDDENVQFHEIFMTADDLSMSKVKNSGISNIVEAVKSKQVDATDFKMLPPLAIRDEYERQLKAVKGSNQSPDNQQKELDTAANPKPDSTKIDYAAKVVRVESPSKPISQNVRPAIINANPVLKDIRLYEPGKQHKRD